MSRIVVATINAAGVTSSASTTLENVVRALPGVGIAFVQEAKPLRRQWSLRNQLSRRTIGVHQATRRASTAGTAIVWDRSRVSGQARELVLAVRPGPGDDMLARYLPVVELTIDEELTVTAIGAHRPPKRLRHLWPAFDRALAEQIRAARHPVIVGTDYNSTSLSPTLRAYVGGYALGIDAILVDHRLKVRRGPYELPRTRSDHTPIALDLEVEP